MPPSTPQILAREAALAIRVEWRPGGPARPAQHELPKPRSEEYTSELQSRFDLVCRLLLEKKKKKIDIENSDKNNKINNLVETEQSVYYCVDDRLLESVQIVLIVDGV